jgi:hypothetical protein
MRHAKPECSRGAFEFNRKNLIAIGEEIQMMTTSSKIGETS